MQDDPTQMQGTWWKPLIKQSQRETGDALNVSLNSLIVGALQHSAKIQVISDEPLISEQDITTADAEFDWTSFLEYRWDDTSDPVGSTLTTGGASRFRDHNVTFEAGMRRRNTLGGEFEVGQRFGHQNNNSVFFVPNDQGTSRLTLSYTQPLLRGSGRVYNTSLTVLAQLNTKITRDDFHRQLQDHLVDVTQSYWNLYFERGRLLQQQRLLESGEAILGELESRSEIDALKSQIVRARAAVENRRAQLVRSRLSIRNAEARVRSLVNDPRLGDTLSLELIPREDLSEEPFEVSLQPAIALGLQSRPEVSAALKQIKAACVRMNIGKNETLPLLNVVLETYSAGLEGDSKVARAFEAMFDEGEPGYGLGLQYERPIWNRAATSRLQKRRLEVRRLQNQFRLTVETLKLEVEVAVHELNGSYESLKARRRAMDAAFSEVEYLRDRWLLLPTDNGSASLLLEDLLDAQERLADAELSMLQAALEYTLAQGGYKRATGTLLSESRISTGRSCKCGLPRQNVMQIPKTEFMEVHQPSMAVEHQPMSQGMVGPANSNVPAFSRPATSQPRVSQPAASGRVNSQPNVNSPAASQSAESLRETRRSSSVTNAKQSSVTKEARRRPFLDFRRSAGSDRSGIRMPSEMSEPTSASEVSPESGF